MQYFNYPRTMVCVVVCAAHACGASPHSAPTESASESIVSRPRSRLDDSALNETAKAPMEIDGVRHLGWVCDPRGQVAEEYTVRNLALVGRNELALIETLESVYVVDCASAQIKCKLKGRRGVAFDSASRTVWVLSGDRTAERYDLNGKLLKSIDLLTSARRSFITEGLSTRVSDWSVVPKSTWCAYRIGGQDIGMFNFETSTSRVVGREEVGPEVRYFRGHCASLPGASVVVCAVTEGVAQEKLSQVSCSDGRTIRQFDLSDAASEDRGSCFAGPIASGDGKLVTAVVERLKVAADKREVAVSWSILLWKLDDGLSNRLVPIEAKFERHKDVGVPGTGQNQCKVIDLSPDGRFLLFCSDDGLRYLDVKTAKEQVCDSAREFYRSAAFSDDGKLVVAASGRGDIRIWKWESLARP